MVSLRTEDRPVDAPTPILRKVNDNTFKVSAVNDCNSIVPVAEVAGPSWNEIAAPKGGEGEEHRRDVEDYDYDYGWKLCQQRSAGADLAFARPGAGLSWHGVRIAQLRADL